MSNDVLRVGICVPSFDDVKTDFWFDFSGMLWHTAAVTNGRVHVNVFNHRTSKLPTSRNNLVKDAIKWGAHFVFFLDSDMRFPPDTLVRLINHRKPVVAANCVLRCFPSRATAYRDNAFVWTEADSTGLEEVDAVGTAIMLIHETVWEKISPPPFMFEHRPDKPMDPLGEDQYFCKIAKEAGIPIYIDHDLSKEVGHVGTLTYTMAMARACRDKAPVLLGDMGDKMVRNMPVAG